MAIFRRPLGFFIAVMSVILTTTSWAEPVELNVLATITESDADHVVWQASIPDIAVKTPELNAGDAVHVIGIKDPVTLFGTWSRVYTWTEDGGCHGGFLGIGKTCDKINKTANDSASKSFDLLTAPVKLEIVFVPLSGHGAAINKLSLSSQIGQTIPIRGPMQMTISGGVSAVIPKDMDPDRGHHGGSVHEDFVLGRGVPAHWFTLQLDFKAAQQSK
jgi:hypothetical protein